MGGNGSYSYFVANTLGSYEKDRYKTIDMIGKDKVINVITQKNNKTPMNSFTSDMYYVTDPKQPGIITNIAFYDKRNHCIKRSIDLVYDKDGKFKGYDGENGTHVHRWKMLEDGTFGRKTHDNSNCYEPTRTDMMYIKRALKYNSEHKQQKNG